MKIRTSKLMVYTTKELLDALGLRMSAVVSITTTDLGLQVGMMTDEVEEEMPCQFPN